MPGPTDDLVVCQDTLVSLTHSLVTLPHHCCFAVGLFMYSRLWNQVTGPLHTYGIAKSTDRGNNFGELVPMGIEWPQPDCEVSPSHAHRLTLTVSLSLFRLSVSLSPSHRLTLEVSHRLTLTLPHPRALFLTLLFHMRSCDPATITIFLSLCTIYLSPTHPLILFLTAGHAYCTNEWPCQWLLLLKRSIRHYPRQHDALAILRHDGAFDLDARPGA